MAVGGGNGARAGGATSDGTGLLPVRSLWLAGAQHAWLGEGEERDNLQYQKAALGKFWSHAPTTRINTTRLAGSDVLLTVTKSSNVPVGKSITVTITETGVS